MTCIVCYVLKTVRNELLNQNNISMRIQVFSSIRIVETNLPLTNKHYNKMVQISLKSDDEKKLSYITKSFFIVHSIFKLMVLGAQIKLSAQFFASCQFCLFYFLFIFSILVSNSRIINNVNWFEVEISEII